MPVQRWDRSSPPRLHVRLPDGSTRCIPLAWTDQADPCVDHAAGSQERRLSVSALLGARTWVQEMKQQVDRISGTV